MSSIEEEVFFGSRQLALDSYLKAREEQRDDSQLPRRKGVAYPNVLDDISYQKSFEKEYRSGEQASLPYNQHRSIVFNNQKHQALRGSFYLSISQLHFKCDAIKEGACIEVGYQLGDMKIAELVFYSDRNPIVIEDYFKVALSDQDFSSYFKASKASCLKVEVSAKEFNYDNKIGSGFMPIQSVIMLLEELSESKLNSVRRRVDLRFLSQRRSKTQTDSTITFVLTASKLPPASQQPQTFRAVTKEIEKQKVQIRFIEVQLKLPSESIEVEYQLSRHPIQVGGLLTLSLEKCNETLNRGLKLGILINGEKLGTLDISVLHLFISQTIRGKYPVLHANTAEYIGSIEMELSEPVIKPTRIHQRHSPERTNEVKIQRGHRKEKLVNVLVLSAVEIIYMGSADLTHGKFYLICHRNKEVCLSNEFKFRKSDALFVSEQPADIDLASSTPDTQQIVLELYQKGVRYDELMSYSKFKVAVPQEQIAWSEECEVDCKVNNGVSKIRLYLSTLTYPEGYFVEDKLVRVMHLFHGSNIRRLQTLQPEEDFKNVLRKELGLTFMEIDRLHELFQAAKGKPLTEFLPRYKKGEKWPTINFVDTLKELEYSDNNNTGYISELQLKTIFGYFECSHVDLSRYLKASGNQVTDIVFQDRRLEQSMVSYLALLLDISKSKVSQDQAEQLPPHKPEHQNDVAPVNTFSSPSPIRLMVLRASNLNSLNPLVKSPNSYVVEEVTGQSTQVCHRNCNPQYVCELSINTTSQVIKFKVMHKDFKTADCQLAQFSLDTQKLQSQKTMRISLGNTAFIEFQATQ